MLLLLLSSFPEKLLFLLLIIEFAVNWVVVMCVPVFASYLLYLFWLACTVMLAACTVMLAVELFGVLLKQFLLPFHWKPQLLILEKVFRQLLVVYYIVGVSYRPTFSVHWLLLERFV